MDNILKFFKQARTIDRGQKGDGKLRNLVHKICTPAITCGVADECGGKGGKKAEE